MKNSCDPFYSQEKPFEYTKIFQTVWFTSTLQTVYFRLLRHQRRTEKKGMTEEYTSRMIPESILLATVVGKGAFTHSGVCTPHSAVCKLYAGFPYFMTQIE